jgi:hypothetical protein
MTLIRRRDGQLTGRAEISSLVMATITNQNFIYVVTLAILHCTIADEESIMSTFILPTHQHTLATRFADVSHAVRTVAAALFAAQERQYVAQEVVKKAGVSARNLYKTRLQLFAMARECEDMSPSQAAELRNLAGRD